MTNIMSVKIAVIGGSGFYDIDSLSDIKVISVNTPFGKPSDDITTGILSDQRIAFLPRHGKGHTLNPSEVNYRANLFALKELGVEKIISSTAVGSLKEEIKPTDLVIPDQYFDNTFKRQKTYFEKGIVAHVSMANPACPFYTELARKTADEIGIKTHIGGTYFNMEGPQFSSRGESEVYKKLDFSIIGMTQAIEAKLAKELEICFIPLAFVTDYDCWHPEHDSVSVDMVISNLNKNRDNALKLIKNLLLKINNSKPSCNCNNSLKFSFVSDPKKVDDKIKERLMPVIKKYI